MNFCNCFKRVNHQPAMRADIDLEYNQQREAIEELNQEESLENVLKSLQDELNKVDYDQIQELDNLDLKDPIFSIKYPKMHKFLLDLDELASFSQSKPNEPNDLKYQRSIKLLKSFYDLKHKVTPEVKVPEVIDVVTNERETLDYLEEIVLDVKNEIVSSELALDKTDILASKIDKLISVIEEIKITIPKESFYEYTRPKIETFTVSQLGNDLRLFKYDKRDDSEGYIAKFYRLNPNICIDLKNGSDLKKLLHRLKEFFSAHSYITTETTNRFFDLVREITNNNFCIPLSEIQLKVSDPVAKEIFFGSILLNLFDYKIFPDYYTKYNSELYFAISKRGIKGYLFKVVEKNPSIHHGETPQALYKKFSDEKKIHLIANKSVFFEKLVATFQTKFYLVLAIEKDNAYYLESRINFELSISPEVVQTYAFKLLSAINYLHTHGIIHRDIKATNILVNEATGCCKIVDFKFSKIMAQNERTFSRLRDYTWGYDAPEMHLSKGYSFQVDYWALGVLIFRMITKRFPFTDLNAHLINPDFKPLKLQSPNDFRISLMQNLDVLNLLKHLFKRNPDRRVTITQKPANYIMEDEVWNALQNGTYVPNIHVDLIRFVSLGNNETFSFIDKIDKRCLNDWYTAESIGEFDNHEHYKGFTYINKDYFSEF